MILYLDTSALVKLFAEDAAQGSGSLPRGAWERVVQPAEWEALRSLNAPTMLSVNGYLAVLLAICGNVSEL